MDLHEPGSKQSVVPKKRVFFLSNPKNNTFLALIKQLNDPQRVNL